MMYQLPTYLGDNIVFAAIRNKQRQEATNTAARLKQLGIELELAQFAGAQRTRALQEALAPSLRKAAIEHLREGDGVVAKGFRGEYHAVSAGTSTQSFLAKQAQNGVWATYIEAEALAETLGCHLVVTPVTDGNEGDPICLRRAENDKTPVIHLYNSDNSHWYVDGNTQGDGNCLYNAFAQALAAQVRSEKQMATEIASGQISSHNTLFSNNPQAKQSVAQQRDILEAIKTQPTPTELAKQLAEEKDRIAKLSPDQQQQISDDHAIALQLAMNDPDKFTVEDAQRVLGLEAEIKAASMGMRSR